tara:strand:+ start:3039 stop:3218 length:180 start_codon:yes stop_codon:yes gene_type:complete
MTPEEITSSIEVKFSLFEEEILNYKQTSKTSHWFNAIKIIRDIADQIDDLELKTEAKVN